MKDVNQIYCGDCFVIYRNSKSLFYTPETKIISQLYLNLKNCFFNLKKKKNDKASQQREKIAFSGSGAETTGYPHANE